MAITISTLDTLTVLMIGSFNVNSGILTSKYGTFRTDTSSHEYHLDQGIVTGVQSWNIYQYDTNIEFDGGMGNFIWESYQNSGSRISNSIGAGYGNDGIYECEPFDLESGDYIHGYRVISDLYIVGLYFHTKANQIYDCIADNITNTNVYNDSGLILHANHYLSGFVFDAGWIIDGLQFQFTPFPSNPPTPSPISIARQSQSSTVPSNDRSIFTSPTSLPTSISSASSTMFPLSTTDFANTTTTVNPTPMPTMGEVASAQTDGLSVNVVQSTMQRYNIYAANHTKSDTINIWIIMTITLGFIVLICGIIIIFGICQRRLLLKNKIDTPKTLHLEQVPSTSNRKEKWMDKCEASGEIDMELQIVACDIENHQEKKNVTHHNVKQDFDDSQDPELDACSEGDERALPETAKGTIGSEMMALPQTTKGLSDEFEVKEMHGKQSMDESGEFVFDNDDV